MTGNRKPDQEFEKAATLLVLLTAVPIFAIAAIVTVFQALGPAVPFLVVAAITAGLVYAFHRFQTSPLTVRREHQKEVLALLGRAEMQQQALPRSIVAADLLAALRNLEVRTDIVQASALLSPAQAIYTEEFLRALPPMPGVPGEAERVYDIDYDRRTLKKGEEPPHRYRTDSKGRPTSVELETFKAWLHRYVVSTDNPAATYNFFVARYAEFAAIILRQLPEVAAAPPGGFTVPLIDFLPNGKAIIAQGMGVFQQQSVREWHHFSTIREAFAQNRQKVSALQLRERDLAAGLLLDPDKFAGTAHEAVDSYLANTPLKGLFLAEIPFALPVAKRFEGHWIVARQGSGKTNALECLIHNDLAEVAAGRASLLVMDSQGIAEDTLIGRLATLKAFSRGGALEGKLIYLEPDLEYPLALNVFDIRMNEMGQLTEAQREDVVGSACDVVEFLFTGLLAGELSDNMTMLYRYLVPAMLAIPDADMGTFIELLDTDSGRDRVVPAGFQKYREHFAKLEPEIRSFLETDYLRDPELVKTKAAVRRRLRAALADTTFRRMFMQPRNKLDLFRELQSAKVILVNTYPAKGHVEPFGRLILSLLMQATRQRLEIDRAQRMPTFVYLDECQDYIAREERIAKYIDKCRKQNVGLVFAHQRLSNIENPRVLNALSGLAIKFSGVSDADSSDLASMVGSTSEHIRGLPRGRFAAYVSGLTPQAIDLNFPLSPLEHAPRLTKQGFEALRQEMRHKYGTRYTSRVEVAAEPPPIVSPGSDDGAMGTERVPPQSHFGGVPDQIGTGGPASPAASGTGIDEATNPPAVDAEDYDPLR